MSKKINQLVKEAKETFPSHQTIRLRVKKHPVNPFNSSIMGKIIEMSKLHPEYIFYIHEKYNYLTYHCPSIENFEPVRIRIDNKLWVELLSVFELVKGKHK